MKHPLVWAVWLVEPDGVLAVVDGETKAVASGSTNLLPLLIRGFHLVPESRGSTLADRMVAVRCRGVAHPGAVSLGKPCFGRVATAGDEGEVIPSAPGHGKRGEEFAGAGFFGDDVDGEAGVSGVTLPIVDGAKRMTGCVVPVKLAQRHESAEVGQEAAMR